MNRDEVVRLARECGDWNGQTCEVNDVGLERFAELVAAAEREECAKVCDAVDKDGFGSAAALVCAKDIRARGSA